ncbi:STM3941 family protein [Kitasatospora sp. NPDC093558]|uniref:STM3941 family protein n=1 Tax=Kitasatospora sp. NPDC093558 TaxID=3155201 RepID=UPI00341497ED
MINETTSLSPTVYAQARRKTVLLLLGAVAFTVVGALLLWQHDTLKGLIGGALAVPFFGAAAVLLAVRLVRNRPELVLDAHGLEHVQLGRIAWTEVTAVRVRTMTVRGSTQRMIEVVLADPAAYLARAPRLVRAGAGLNRSLGCGPANIAANTLPVPLEEVLAAVHRHHPRLGGSAG